MNELPPKRKRATISSSNDNAPPNNFAQKHISPEKNPITTTVTAVEIAELSEQEQSLRLHLERKVERAFFEAGKALMELRDGLTPRRRRSPFISLNSPYFRGILPSSPLALAKPSLWSQPLKVELLNCSSRCVRKFDNNLLSKFGN
ncbi:hypothetical protein WKK05_40010 (plasmid) [Nostoc sp. UHCC 0302]|uniref:hypothetical protein n=1 Tax=Nostoc sp. UHCC 0302 TaxID=3134896 RepID=UPI00311CCBFB